MPSPFRAFRKYQKVMIALLCLMAMIAFVFLDPRIIEWWMGLWKAEPYAVTTTQYGSLRERDLQNLLYQRRAILSFLDRVSYAIQQQRGYPLRVLDLQARIGPVDEESVVRTWLLVQRAKEIGIVVSDKTVNEALQAVTRGISAAPQGKDSKPQVREVTLDMAKLKEILVGLRLGQAQLIELLRQELLALRVTEMFDVSLGALTPAQRWGYFLRLNREATIEALPVPVADFVGQVEDPDDATLQAFFDKHKDRLALPTSSEPGFREPHRIAVEYLRADRDKLADLAAVTEEEIRQYYEENKEFYREEPEKPAAAPKPAVETPKAAATPKPAPETPKPAADAPKPAPESSKPADGGAKPAKTAPSPPEKKPAASEADKKPPAGKAEPGAKKSSGASPQPASPYRFTSFAGDAPPKPAPKPAEPVAKPQEPAIKAKPAEKKAPAPAQPSAKPAEPVAKPAEPAAKPKGPAAEAKPAEKKAPAPAQPEPISEKNRKRIRERLALRKAEEKIQKLLISLQDKMEDYRQRWLDWEVAQQTGKGAKGESRPQKPDFAEWAKQYKLTAQATGLVPPWGMQGYDISDSRFEGRTPFVEYAFQTLGEFKPAILQDGKGSSYLAWKVEDAKEQIPGFEDEGVAERVKETWKLLQARVLGEKHAASLAEQARTAGKSLAELFGTRPGRAVLKPQLFTWMTYGVIPARLTTRQSEPRISEVTGIDAPGHEFMRAVFDLAPGGVGVAPDQPKKVYYVVRMLAVGPPDADLWRSFRDDRDSQFILRMAAMDQQEASRAWLEGIQASAGFKWVREPSRGRQE